MEKFLDENPTAAKVAGVALAVFCVASGVALTVALAIVTSGYFVIAFPVMAALIIWVLTSETLYQTLGCCGGGGGGGG